MMNRSILKSFSKSKKHPFLLLEVLIAFMLVVLCVVPMLLPHIQMLITERATTKMLLVEQKGRLLQTDIIEKLYTNEIAWYQIENETLFPIEGSSWKKLGYNGFYYLSRNNRKRKKGIHQIDLVMELTPLASPYPLKSIKLITPLIVETAFAIDSQEEDLQEEYDDDDEEEL